MEGKDKGYLFSRMHGDFLNDMTFARMSSEEMANVYHKLVKKLGKVEWRTLKQRKC